MACRRSGVRIPLAPPFFAYLFDKKTLTIGSGSRPDLRERCLRIASALPVACRRPGSLLHGNLSAEQTVRHAVPLASGSLPACSPVRCQGRGRLVQFGWIGLDQPWSPPQMQLRSAIAAGRSSAVKLSPVSGSAVAVELDPTSSFARHSPARCYLHTEFCRARARPRPRAAPPMAIVKGQPPGQSQVR
jgi:hypothetical protein